jgi:hypothetical protein
VETAPFREEGGRRIELFVRYRQRQRGPRVRKRAWTALVKELGIVDASRFVMAVEPGEGDSVEKYAKLWDGMRLEAVHHDILKAREQGEIAP